MTTNTNTIAESVAMIGQRLGPRRIEVCPVHGIDCEVWNDIEASD